MDTKQTFEMLLVLLAEGAHNQSASDALARRIDGELRGMDDDARAALSGELRELADGRDFCSLALTMCGL